jgi:hypothetical protein
VRMPRKEPEQGPRFHNAVVYAAIRRMLSDSEDFYYDDTQTAIRRVSASALTAEKLGSMYQNLVVAGHEQSSMHVGLELIWAGAVTPDFSSDIDRYYVVVTLEGGLPATQAEFDRLVFGTSG